MYLEFLDNQGITQSGARFLNAPKNFRAWKAIRKTPTRLFCKADLFICCKGTGN